MTWAIVIMSLMLATIAFLALALWLMYYLAIAVVEKDKEVTPLDSPQKDLVVSQAFAETILRVHRTNRRKRREAVVFRESKDSLLKAVYETAVSTVSIANVKSVDWETGKVTLYHYLNNGDPGPTFFRQLIDGLQS